MAHLPESFNQHVTTATLFVSDGVSDPGNVGTLVRIAIGLDLEGLPKP